MRKRNWDLLTETALTARAKGVRRAKRRIGDSGCEICCWRPPIVGFRGAGLHGHHVIPVAAGGDPGEANVVVLCPNHHTIAHVIGEVVYAGLPADSAPRDSLIRWLRLADSAPVECAKLLRAAGRYVTAVENHLETHPVEAEIVG